MQQNHCRAGNINHSRYFSSLECCEAEWLNKVSVFGKWLLDGTTFTYTLILIHHIFHVYIDSYRTPHTAEGEKTKAGQQVWSPGKIQEAATQASSS